MGREGCCTSCSASRGDRLRKLCLDTRKPLLVGTLQMMPVAFHRRTYLCLLWRLLSHCIVFCETAVGATRFGAADVFLAREGASARGAWLEAHVATGKAALAQDAFALLIVSTLWQLSSHCIVFCETAVGRTRCGVANVFLVREGASACVAWVGGPCCHKRAVFVQDASAL